MNVSKEYTQEPWSATHLSIVSGATDLATLLGLSRPSVVTNWRSRDPDFPREKGVSTTPQYDVVEVMRWLRLSGSRVREVPVISPERWWSAVVGAFQGQGTMPSPRGTMVALVLLHRVLLRDAGAEGREHWAEVVAQPAVARSESRDDPRRLADAVVRAARWAQEHVPSVDGLLLPAVRVSPSDAGGLCDLVRALRWYELRAMETGTPRDPWIVLLDTVLATGADGRPKPARVTSAALATLMVECGSTSPPSVVLDPAAGEGALLLAASRRLAEGGQLYGQELDADTWRIARSVLVVHDVAADLDRPGHSSITDDQHPDLRADLVLVDPPIGPGAPPLDLWVEHGVRHLAPRGRLVIAVPMSELVEVRASRRTANARLVGYVQQLAADRRIESVVAVPRGARRDVVGPLAVMTIVAEPMQRSIVDTAVAQRRSDDGFDALAQLHHVPVDVASLFGWLESVASDLETRVSKGPRSGRNSESWSPAFNRSIRYSMSDSVMSELMPPDAIDMPSRGGDAVGVAIQLVDLLRRNAATLGDDETASLRMLLTEAQRTLDRQREP